MSRPGPPAGTTTCNNTRSRRLQQVQQGGGSGGITERRCRPGRGRYADRFGHARLQRIDLRGIQAGRQYAMMGMRLLLVVPGLRRLRCPCRMQQ
jgi:hypothetical protein